MGNSRRRTWVQDPGAKGHHLEAAGYKRLQQTSLEGFHAIAQEEKTEEVAEIEITHARTSPSPRNPSTPASVGTPES